MIGTGVYHFFPISIFGLHQKITMLNILTRHQGVGLGQPPPPFGNFSHIVPFFSDHVPKLTDVKKIGVPTAYIWQ